MSFVKEFNSKSLVLWRAYQLALIVVDVKVLASVDQCKELGTLDNHIDGISYIENEWRSPVLRYNVVYVALACCTNNHESKLDAHIDDSLPVVQVLVHLI